jgi:hypothetical protein
MGGSCLGPGLRGYSGKVGMVSGHEIPSSSICRRCDMWSLNILSFWFSTVDVAGEVMCEAVSSERVVFKSVILVR